MLNDIISNKRLDRRDFLKKTGQAAAFVGVTALGLESILSGCATRPPTAGFNRNFKGPGYEKWTFMKSIYDGWTPGIGWKVSPNTPMVAAAAGIVGDRFLIRMAGHAGGYHLAVDHAPYHTSYYSHLNKVVVECGKPIQRGDVLGYAGDADTYHVAKFVFRVDGSNVNPDNYGPNHSYMQYWDGSTNLEIEDTWTRYENQEKVFNRFHQSYHGKDKRDILWKEHTTADTHYFGKCEWSLVEKFRYLETKYLNNPNQFELSKMGYEALKKEFYNNQPIILTLPFKKP